MPNEHNEHTDQPRDEHGHFLPKNVLDDSTLIDIKVSNPLKRIYDLLAEIKKHQSTTLSLKFTIPLIALPVFLFAAFQLGRGETACIPLTTTKVGVLKNITVDVPKNPPSGLMRLLAVFRKTQKVTPASELVTADRAVLINAWGETLTIVHEASTGAILKGLENQKVMVTGTYSACTSSITLESGKNVSGL